MFNRKVAAFLMVGIFTCISVFGQNVTTVKEFERARRTVPVAITLNLFGFGIGSFIQGDIKGGLIQLGISTVGYALLLPGIFGKFEIDRGKYNGGVTESPAAKYSLIGIGSALVAGNAIFGTIRSTLYPFDKQFDAFYDTKNGARWPAGGN